MVCDACRRLIENFVMTADTSARYFYPGAIAAAAVLAVALRGFRTSAAGRTPMPAQT